MPKIVFIEPQAPNIHIFSQFPLPRLGVLILGTIWTRSLIRTSRSSSPIPGAGNFRLPFPSRRRGAAPSTPAGTPAGLDKY